MGFKEEFDKFGRNEKNYNYKEEIMNKIERKVDFSKGQLDKIIRKDQNLLKLSEIENSNLLNVESSQNKSISN